jgi:hypothetical protein
MIGGVLALPLSINCSDILNIRSICEKSLLPSIKNECHEGHSHMEHHMEEEAEVLERIFTEKG